MDKKIKWAVKGVIYRVKATAVVAAIYGVCGGLARPNLKKQKKRRRCRYGRTKA